jgi:type I restriction enzyme S subunit
MNAGWKTVKLGDVARYDKAQGIHSGLPYVGLEHIESGTRKFIGSRSDMEVHSSTFLFNPNHVLYGRLRPYLRKVLVPNFAGHCSTEIFPILPSDDLDRSYLSYWLITESTTGAIDRLCNGARMPRANMEQALELEIPLPPLAEQKRIVALLDEAFAGIDAAKTKAEANLENAKALFNSHVQAIFNQGTEGWRNTRLEEISTNLDSKRVPITKNIRASGEFPYYGASGIVDYVESYIFEGDNLLVSEDGANLLARSTPIAFSVTGKYWVNNHAHILHFENMATQRFVEFYLESIKLDGYITGAAQPKLTQKALNSIPIPIPDSIKEQGVIVRSVESLKQETTDLSRFYELKMVELKELKSSLLSKAFAGELTA